MKKITLLISALFILTQVVLVAAAEESVLVVDDMKKMKNNLNGRCAVYQKAPSRAGFSKIEVERNGKADKVLKIKFDKKGEGGPYGNGGWCGYYTLVKKGKNFLDVSGYKKLTLWVKGEKGGEKFKIGAADQTYEASGDSAKSDEIGAYLPDKKITTKWQKAVIPLDDIFIEWSMLASLAVNFETDLYENGAANGVVYIDEIQFEK
ncbi:MAG: CIA30 family protein [Spirochaetes bacterium]|nr:CIA30 family protein [Spirochaetota bacterium]